MEVTYLLSTEILMHLMPLSLGFFSYSVKGQLKSSKYPSKQFLSYEFSMPTAK
jgi:hypothetical protein